MKFMLTALTAILLVAPAFSQTVHKDDIYGFIGILSSVYENSKNTTDYSGFIRWEVRDSMTARRRDLPKEYFNPQDEALMTMNDHEYPHQIEKRERWWPYAQAYRQLRFYTMYDGSRWGARNILTVWELTENDSLQLKCIRHANAISKVHTVGFFPDSSLLVVLEGRNGDADFVNGIYQFLRSKESLCDFEEVYSSRWAKNETGSANTFVFYNIDLPVREIVEVTEYSTPIVDDITWRYNRVDSASVKVIDLWGKVKQK